MRKSQKPQYIKPESIRIGDHIRVTWGVEDGEFSATGTVAKRNHVGRYTEWMTDKGLVLLARDPHMKPVSPTYESPVRKIRVFNRESTDVALFGDDLLN